MVATTYSRAPSRVKSLSIEEPPVIVKTITLGTTWTHSRS